MNRHAELTFLSTSLMFGVALGVGCIFFLRGCGGFWRDMLLCVAAGFSLPHDVHMVFAQSIHRVASPSIRCITGATNRHPGDTPCCKPLSLYGGLEVPTASPTLAPVAVVPVRRFSFVDLDFECTSPAMQCKHPFDGEAKCHVFLHDCLRALLRDWSGYGVFLGILKYDRRRPTGGYYAVPSC